MGRSIENEEEKLKYVEIYKELKKHSPKCKQDIVTNSILKAQIEWVFEDIVACRDNVNIALDNFVLDENIIDILVMLSIFTGQFDKLLEKIFIVSEKRINKNFFSNKSIVSKAFSSFLNVLANNETFETKDLLSENTTVKEKSIIFYLIYKLAQSKEEKLQALRIAYAQYNNNLSVAKELYLLGEEIDKDTIRMLYKLDINLFYNFKKVRNEFKNISKYNFSFLPLGGGDEIGANSYIVTIGEYNFIIDAGVKIRKEGNIYPDYTGLDFLVGSIDAVIITHAHLDHCGALIKLYNSNNRLKFIMTLETRELIKLNLKNTDISPNEMYDLEKLLQKAIILQFNKPFKWQGKGLTIELYRAGHILGAASVLIKTKECNVFITGDYTLDNQETVRGMELPLNEKIDILITENTYGNREIKDIIPRKLQYESLKKYVVEKINEGKKILIPAFAIGRAQELICCLKKLAIENNFRIYVDGLAVEASELYEKYGKVNLHGRNIHYIKNSVYETKEDFIIEEFMNNRSCVIASSGMLQEGSTSAVYAKYLLQQPNASCILSGYQACDTLGARIIEQMKLDCDKYIMIENENYLIKSELESFRISSHCNIDEILTVINVTNPKKVILVHGELQDGKSELFEILKKNSFLEVYQSKNNEVIKL